MPRPCTLDPDLERTARLPTPTSVQPLGPRLTRSTPEPRAVAPPEADPDPGVEILYRGRTHARNTLMIILGANTSASRVNQTRSETQVESCVY